MGHYGKRTTTQRAEMQDTEKTVADTKPAEAIPKTADTNTPLNEWLSIAARPAIQYGLKLLSYLAWLAAITLAVRYFGSSGSQIPVPPTLASIEKPADDLPPEPLWHCGRTETLADNLATAPWPTKEITWNVDTTGYSGNLTREQIIEAFDVAFKAWAKWIDIKPRYIDDHDAALVQCHFQAIDGPSKVLAWSELSDGKLTPKTQRYDRGERWTIATNPTQATIDIVRVACHEIGHVLGLVHDEVDSNALMRPTYSLQQRFPTARDAQRLYAMGYPKRPVATPAEPITLSVTVDPERLAELLRGAGYDVKLLGR